MDFYYLRLLVLFLRTIITDSINIIILLYFKYKKIDDVIKKYGKNKLKKKNRDKNKNKMKLFKNDFFKFDSNLSRFNK